MRIWFRLAQLVACAGIRLSRLGCWVSRTGLAHMVRQAPPAPPAWTPTPSDHDMARIAEHLDRLSGDRAVFKVQDAHPVTGQAVCCSYRTRIGRA